MAPWDLDAMPGTGDIWSTAGDLTRFTAALHCGELIAASSLRAMCTGLGPAGGEPGLPRLGGQLHPVGNARRAAPLPVLRPGLRQVQFPVDQHMPVRERLVSLPAGPEGPVRHTGYWMGPVV